MRPTWVLSAPDGPHFGPMNLCYQGRLSSYNIYSLYICMYVFLLRIRSIVVTSRVFCMRAMSKMKICSCALSCLGIFMWEDLCKHRRVRNPLEWRHNGRDSVSNLNRLFGRRSTKTHAGHDLVWADSSSWVRPNRSLDISITRDEVRAHCLIFR